MTDTDLLIRELLNLDPSDLVHVLHTVMREKIDPPEPVDANLPPVNLRLPTTHTAIRDAMESFGQAVLRVTEVEQIKEIRALVRQATNNSSLRIKIEPHDLGLLLTRTDGG